MNSVFHLFTQKRVAAVLACLFFMQFSIVQAQTGAIDGTTGAPLGGIGCGAVKFCAHNGTFAGTFRNPCALDDFKGLSSTQLQFYSKNGSSVVTKEKLSAVITNGRADDDAVYPVHYANFGTINGVSVTLTAFTPWEVSKVDLMCYPYAFFQIELKNTAAESIEAAVAFQTQFTSATIVQGKGVKDGDPQIVLERAVYVTTDDPDAVISAGNDGGFLTSGQCNNQVSGTTNKVAAKVALAAGQSKNIKFVFAWHNKVTGYEGNKDGMFYYLNAFKEEAGPVADTGLAHFDQFRDNAVALVTRMRASNFPDWIKNQALVTLANLTNNSMYRQDGRYAHTEGEWSTNGTMDQMFHARQIYSMLVPSLNWQELQYWARTQKTSPAGQIHHDIDSCTDIENYAMSRNMAYMCPWDAAQHHDYREIDKWVDLNCAFIISVYETFIATADTAQLTYFWPYVKKAGQRMMDQLSQYNDVSYPYLYSGTENSYDADGALDINFYNSSLAAITYKILSVFAAIKGDADQQKYVKYYDSTKAQFARKYLRSGSFPTNIRIEALMTGQWLSYYLKTGEIFDTAGVNLALKSLNSYYMPLTNGLGNYPAGTYTEWAEYKTAHYGGLCLETGKYDVWRALQYDWYQRVFTNRNLVYNIPLDVPPNAGTSTYLATNVSGFNEYISTPVVWRLYYSMVGYKRNKYTSELWLEPRIPPEMNHKITNAVVFSPEGWAAVDAEESGTNYKIQVVTFHPDSAIPVKTLYVRDNDLSENYVKINGVLVEAANVTKVGSGYAKELKIAWEGIIPVSGITVTVSDDPDFQSVKNPKKYEVTSLPTFFTAPGYFSVSIHKSAPYEIRIAQINGKTIKSFKGTGNAEYRFSVTGQNGSIGLKTGIYVIKVVSNGKVVNKRFVISR
jgi:uncharacterized protein (DUF608 family)